MSIFKDTFRPYVRKQLSLREELIDLGNSNSRGIRTNRLSKNNVTLQTDDKVEIEAGAFNTYALNKQCIIRMTSMVDYVENVDLEIGGLEGEQSFNSLQGAALSQNFILEGGVLSDFARIRNGKREVRRVSTPRDSFPRPGQRTNLGYGDLNIGADASSDGYGIVPMPGIVDIEVRTKSAYGSLREAKVNFECHNRRQLEVLEMLYMRPGYMVVLEWGWTPYVNNQGKIERDVRLLEDITDGRIYTNNITQQEVFAFVNQLKEERDGNYDGFLGFVKNFGFQAREDGGFSCFSELVSIGEVIESIKMPNLSITSPVVSIPSNSNSTTGGESNITIQSDLQVGGAYAGKQYIDESKFQNALSAGLYPRYSGLLGLAKSLLNYSTFNSFSRGNSKSDRNEEAEFDRIKDVYTPINEENPGQEDDTFDFIKATTEKAPALTGNAARSGYPNSVQNNLINYLKDLIRYQSAGVESFLINKLKLNNAEELRDYIIPVGGKEGLKVRNEQPYIRWDALCTLINENLITKDEKALNPVSIVADRLYDGGGGSVKMDPLLFAPITDYTKTPTNTLLDFSCDPNICILPLQIVTDTVSDSTIDKFKIEDSLGYIPNIKRFPLDYIAATYAKGKDITYNGITLTPSSQGYLDENGNPYTLDDTDSIRRIGNIFLNLEMLNSIAEKNDANEDYTLGQFLKDIWDEVNKACPNHNFVLTDDKESNTIFVIDLPVDNSKLPLDLHEFIPFSNKNILRKFEYTSNVPKAMSATIAIQSQDPRSIQDIDGVTFAAFNRSIKNRILSTDTTSNWNRTQAAISNNEDSILTKQNQLKQQLNRYMLRFFTNLKRVANDEDPVSEGNIANILKEYQKNAAYLKTAVTATSTFSSVIPLEFSAELDGIAGIVIGNMFKVQKDRLPKAYGKTNIGFIVFNEEQKISGQDWVTSISGKMTLLPEKNNRPKVDGFTSTTFTDVEILSETSAVSPGSTTLALAAGQEAATDIGKATAGDPVYLKKMKDNSIRYIDRVGVSPDFYAVKYPSDETYFETGGSVYKPSGYVDGHFYGKTRGYAMVRREPFVDNGVRGYNNVIGAFNSWDDAGMLLGTISPFGGNLLPDGTISEGANTGLYANVYADGRYRILPGAYGTYFPDQVMPDGVYINTVGEPEVIDGISYYKFKSLVDHNGMPILKETLEVISNTLLPADDVTNVKYIRTTDCSNIRNVWYNIEFVPEVDTKFHGGWGWDGYGQIDVRIGTGYNDWTNKFSKKISALSQQNNVWMRHDILAASQASALDPGNMEIINGTQTENPGVE